MTAAPMMMTGNGTAKKNADKGQRRDRDHGAALQRAPTYRRTASSTIARTAAFRPKNKRGDDRHVAKAA